MSKGGKAPSAPDYSGIIDPVTDAASGAYTTSGDMQKYFTDRAATDKQTLDNVVNPALQRQGDFDKYSAEDRARYSDTFVPLQDKFIDTAKNYDSPERISSEMGKAQSTVAQNFDGQRNAALQSLEGYGVDPSSTRFAALDAQTRIAQAAAAAGAGNQARDQTQNTALNLQKAAIDMGAVLPGQALNEGAIANQSGTTAANTTLAGTGMAADTLGTGTNWLNAGVGATNAAAGATDSSYKNKLDSYNAQQSQSSGIGGVLGSLAGSEMPTGADGSGGGSMLASIATKALPFLLADGGAIPATPGGNIPPSASPTGGQATDDVDAKLTVGEFVIPKDVMAWYGEQHFQKLIEKARAAQPQAPAQPKVGMAKVGNPAFVSRPPSAGAIPVH